MVEQHSLPSRRREGRFAKRVVTRGGCVLVSASALPLSKEAGSGQCHTGDADAGNTQNLEQVTARDRSAIECAKDR
jgi:hypothetical protein